MPELILVADDDPFNLKLLTELCESTGYRVHTAADGAAVLDLVARERPDLILLDVTMPRMDGFEVCRVLKSDPHLRGIAVILVTAIQDVDGRLRGIEIGADDYVTKPFRLVELQQRIRTALRLRAAEARIEEVEGRVRELDPKDALTKVGRYHQLRLSLEYEFVRAARYGHPLACVALSVDDLEDKTISDGREAADRVLVELVQEITAGLRGADLLFRFSTDGLVLLLPETDAAGTEVVLQRIVEAHGRASVSGGSPPRARVVVGASVYPAPGIASQDSLLRAAHEAIDVARSNGWVVSAAWR